MFDSIPHSTLHKHKEHLHNSFLAKSDHHETLPHFVFRGLLATKALVITFANLTSTLLDLLPVGT